MTTADTHSPAFCRQILDGAFHRQPDGSLLDQWGRTPEEAALDQQIAGEIATMRVYRRQVSDLRRAHKAAKASGHPIMQMGHHRAEARVALMQWRKHRAELKRLLRLRKPTMIAAE